MSARRLGRRFATWADEQPVALWLRFSAVTVLGAVALTACSWSEPTENAPAESPTVMENVTQVCTPEGHRLYKYRAPYKGGLAVVPNDPTCAGGAS